MLELKHITKIYKAPTFTEKVLNRITLSIDSGERAAIVGPSGAGKTTLMNIMGTLDTPTSGEYCLDGLAINTLHTKQKALLRNQNIGFIFQKYYLLSKFSVEQNIQLPWRYSKNPDHNYYEKLIRQLGIQHLVKKHPNQLSGGQQQRVAIARALLNKPKLVLADEPTGALDKKNGDEVMSILMNLDQSCTVVIITHNQIVAQQCSQIINIHDGNVTCY